MESTSLDPTVKMDEDRLDEDRLLSLYASGARDFNRANVIRDHLEAAQLPGIFLEQAELSQAHLEMVWRWRICVALIFGRPILEVPI